MDPATRQDLLFAAAGIGGAMFVVFLARRSLLTMRYTLGWLAVFSISIVAALFNWLITPLANALGMTPTGVLLAAATALLLGITLQLSISICRLQERLRDLAESEALLRDEIGRSTQRVGTNE